MSTQEATPNAAGGASVLTDGLGGISDNERMLRLMVAIQPMDPRNRALILQAADEIARLRSALREAIDLRVKLWRNGDFEGDDDHLTDEQVARKEPYAKNWLAALLTPNGQG